MRLRGFSRFTELLERHFKKLMLANLFTVIGFLPLMLGIAYSVLASSLLILLPASLVGGGIAGIFLSGMYDTVFRILRDEPTTFRDYYRRALKQNLRPSILVGMVLGLLLGFYSFMAAMVSWATAFPSVGTIIVYLVGLLLLAAISSIYFPQLVLFEQSAKERLQNGILFSVRFFWRLLGCAFLKMIYWLIFALFLPWSFVLLPIIGFWLILFVTNFLLYDAMNNAFGIEEKIAEKFPDQVAYYETDEDWLERKSKK